MRVDRSTDEVGLGSELFLIDDPVVTTTVPNFYRTMQHFLWHATRRCRLQGTPHKPLCDSAMLSGT